MTVTVDASWLGQATATKIKFKPHDGIVLLPARPLANRGRIEKPPDFSNACVGSILFFVGVGDDLFLGGWRPTP